MAQLRNSNGARQIAQRMPAQIGQPRLFGELVFDHFLCCRRHDGLAAVRKVAQSSRLVDRGARVVALVAQLHIAGVHADAQLDRRQIRPLQLQRTRHSVAGAGKCGYKAVAFTLFDRAHTVVLGDELGGGLIHACDRGRHRLGLGRPQLG
jgi:hypothetical protein